LGFNYRQSLEDYFANPGSRVVIGFEGYYGGENAAFWGVGDLTNWRGVDAEQAKADFLRELQAEGQGL